MRAQFVLHEIWIGLRRNLTMTVAVITTVAICLTMFGMGLLINQQVSGMKNYWNDKIEVSVFLCVKASPTPVCQRNGPATPQERAQIQQDLQNLPQVEPGGVKYETQQQAYERFKESFKNTPAFVKSTSAAELPDSFRVKLKNPEDYKVIVGAMKTRAGIDSVLDEQQVLDRFFNILNGLKQAAWIVALIQVIAAILLIGNTIRLAAYNRRKETGIMRLVGSSNFFIQLPFLLEGAIAGLIGGLVASVLLALSKIIVFDGIQDYFTFATTMSWSTVISTIGFSVVVGILMCAGASYVTLLRYLRV
ncbi:MAG TPA: permease-like cell division protein FtsX [Streptosporangiaceae bacterium]|jgi:cell division transport system permease protein